MKVFIDGELFDGHGPNAGRIPVTDHGLLYGDGVFEGIRVFGGVPFLLEEHLQRLSYGMRAVHLQLPGGLPRLREAVLTTVKAHGDPDVYVRLIVTRGDGALGVDPASCPVPRVLCLVDRVSIFPEEKRRVGITMATVSVRRPASDVLDPRVKSLNYLNNALARVECRQRGADEALMLNAQGHIAEASVANLFVVQGERVLTPPTTDGALDGITRGVVLQLARDAGLHAEEKTLGRLDVFAADECFLTGTGAGLVRVRSLDGEAIGNGPSRGVVDRLMDAYDARTRPG
jgi:branched-chain amino acid aminotransferase